MKILVILDKYCEVSETFIYKHISVLAQHDLYIFCRKRLNSKNFLVPSNARFYAIYSNPLHRLFLKLFSRKGVIDRFTSGQLKRIQRRENFDAVMVHYGTMLTYSYSALLTKTPIYAFFHGFDLSRKLSDPDYIDCLRKSFKNKDITAVVPSQFLGNVLMEKFDVAAGRVRVIPYGVEQQEIFEASSSSIKREKRKIRVLHAGRIIPKKGLLDLLEVVKKLKNSFNGDFELFLIGDGWSMEEVLLRIDELGLAQTVQVLGELPHHEVISHMKAADIFVLNSQLDHKNETEGFPNTILEAMFAEVPVISTYHAGIPEAVQHMRTGLLVEEKDNEALEACMLQLMTNPKLRYQLATTAKERALARFTIERMKENVDQLLLSKTS